MKLLEYLKKYRVTQRSFAKQVGVTEAYISQILNGLRSPSIRLAGKIEDKTEGNVTFKDLLEEDIRNRTTKNRKDKLKAKTQTE